MIPGFVKWFLIVAVIGTTGARLINKPRKGRKISLQQVEALLTEVNNEIILINVGESEQTEVGLTQTQTDSLPTTEPQGSLALKWIPIPLGQLDASPVLQDIGKSSHIVVACNNRSRSEFAQQMLEDMGYEHVYHLAVSI